MTFMPKGEPRSVPDDAGELYDEMMRRLRRDQAYEVFSRAPGPDPRSVQTLAYRFEDGPPTKRNLPGRADDVGGHLRIGGRSERPDPRKTDVFRRGPDGKLHPIEGWTTTGPFEFDRWRRNIDWGGVADDLAELGAKVLAFGGLPGLASRMGVAGVTGQGLTAMDGVTLGSGLYATGRETLDGLEKGSTSKK